MASIRFSKPAEYFSLPARLQVALQHYTRVEGRAMPMTSALLAKSRPEALVLNWGMGTLAVFGPDCILSQGAGGATPAGCSGA